MEDIIKEIEKAEVEVGQIGEESKIYFKEKTTLPREYLNNEVTKRYSNLVFIRILMKKTSWVLSYHDSVYTRNYYFYSVFIDKNVLEYLSSDILTFELNGEQVLNLTNLSWNEQLKLRNKILKSCPIIVAENETYYEDDECPPINWSTLKLRNYIRVYYPDYKIDDYELLNSTNFGLISNSQSLSQGDLNKCCLEILSKFIQETKRLVDDKKAIYLSIIKKLKHNKMFTKEELKVLDEFINGEVDKIDKISDGEMYLIRSKLRRIK